ncbi:helix-turn-helix domain-containing protein [Alteripontixanthobacter maritimus]|nr:helix-turn-helix transcriptional regulator [Alteripontixanthobacter maritimus]
MKTVQQDMFRLAANRGATQKMIAAKTGLSSSVIGQYARGESAMSGPSLFKMIGVIPDDLLSLLLPDGMFFVRAGGDLDHDTLATHCIEYAAEYAAARNPASPDGVDIAECESERLTACGSKLKAVGA